MHTKGFRTSDIRTEFKLKWALWNRCLNSDDPHAINNQILHMVWNYAVWSLIDEARRIGKPLPEGGVAHNWIVHNFIDICYFESQILAIRRLTDNYPLEGEMGVFSLSSLLKDLGNNVELLTKENIATVIEDFSSNHPILSDAKYSPQIFFSLRDRLHASCRNITNHVNKSVAHASSPESRKGFDDEEHEINFRHVKEAIKLICRITNFINVYFISGSEYLCFLPYLMPIDFSYLNAPLYTPSDFKLAMKKWEEIVEESREWGCLDHSDIGLEIE
jgi:hypothetical protein